MPIATARQSNAPFHHQGWRGMTSRKRELVRDARGARRAGDRGGGWRALAGDDGAAVVLEDDGPAGFEFEEVEDGPVVGRDEREVDAGAINQGVPLAVA